MDYIPWLVVLKPEPPVVWELVTLSIGTMPGLMGRISDPLM